MRTTVGLIAMATIVSIIAGCDGSATAPARCDSHTTTASFADVVSLTGVMISIQSAGGSSSATAAEVVTLRVHGNPDFNTYFTVSDSTAVFERAGGAAPTAASACQLAVGQQVQIPYAFLGSGFGDHIPVVGGNNPAPPLPPMIGQIVIVR